MFGSRADDAEADHPAFIFQVVGQSRDDVLAVVQAGGHHPGSQYRAYRPETTTPDTLLKATIQYVTEGHAAFVCQSSTIAKSAETGRDRTSDSWKSGERECPLYPQKQTSPTGARVSSTDIK